MVTPREGLLRLVVRSSTLLLNQKKKSDRVLPLCLTLHNEHKIERPRNITTVVLNEYSLYFIHKIQYKIPRTISSPISI